MKNRTFKLDPRQEEDLTARINELAASYTPEWHPDYHDPDIGTTIGILYARQMEDNIRSYNHIIDQIRLGFVNLLGLSLKPSQPSSTVVELGLIRNTIDGMHVRKGTKLLASDEEALTFETMQPLYVTSSEMKEIMMLDGRSGRIYGIAGSLRKQPLLPEEEQPIETEEEAEVEEETDQITTNMGFEPFSVFDFSSEGLERNALLLFHDRIYDVENQDIYLKIEGSSELLDGIENGRYRLSCYTEEGFVPVKGIERNGNIITFRKELPCAKVNRDMEYSVLALEALNAVTENLEVSSLSFSSRGDFIPVTFVGNGNTDFEVQEFAPFTNTLSLFSECCFGQKEYFSKKGARITVRFELDFEEHLVSMTQEQIDESLKIIKKRPRNVTNDVVADVYAEEVILEYFNGLGWKRLVCDQDVKRLFADGRKCDVEISFIAPEDWQETVDYGFESPALRMRLLQAENCYLIPSRHHYPIIRHLEVAYSYEGKYLLPQSIERINGTIRELLPQSTFQNGPAELFVRNMSADAAIYFGFKNRFEEGPVGIYFELENIGMLKPRSLTFEYSTRKGFRILRSEDGTFGMAKSGIVRFLPPEDMWPDTVEGVKSYWIRIVDHTKEDNGAYPRLKSVVVNAVEVRNLDTQPRDDFYIEEPKPDMHFRVGQGDVCEVQIWVNEADITREEQEKLMRECPDDVKAEYDVWGNVREFYVKWQEVENFYSSQAGDRHYVFDRLGSTVYFGDGIHVRIPRVTDNVAFFSVVTYCGGKTGNVGQGTITEPLSRMNFIDTIRNILPAYGGCDMESLSNVIKRGTNIISSRKRLVTLQDYEREIASVSDSIDKVACVTGQLIDGTAKEDSVSFVLLMKEFAGGTLAFDKLLPRIQERLFEHCEMTIAKEQIQIVEPIRVSVSVDIWLEQNLEYDDFETRELLNQTLCDFLNPLSTENGEGWKIGEMPRKLQLVTKLNSLQLKLKIYKLVILASYTDAQGFHECELQELPNNPFFLCTSGTHTIFFWDRRA